MSNRNLRKPLSLTELKKKRELEKERESKPVFLSEKAREEQSRIAKREKRTNRSNTNNTHREEQSSPARDEDDGFKLADLEKRAIQKRYLGDTGDERERSRASKPSDKVRLRFKWDASEDTTGEEDDIRRQLRRKTERNAFGRAGQGNESFDIHIGRKRRTKTSGPSMPTKRFRARYDRRRWWEKERYEMTERDWRIFREDFMISVRGGKVPNPARNWSECDLPEKIVRPVAAMFEKPTPIQMATIPICVQGQDVIGLAETGSGKTAAYVLPMLKHISKLPSLTLELARHGAYALVLAPTRELALQIEEETKRFSEPLGIRVVAVIGGADMDHQASELQLGAEIIICTPGRMADLIGRRLAALGNCTFLVLDEADRMIDMGFEPKVLEIMSAMPEQNPDEGGKDKIATETGARKSRRRQTLMFSATMVPAVERLARTYLLNPVIVTIGETGQTADNVIQKVEYYENDGRRRNRLIELLKELEPPILVFANTRSGCEVVARFVEQMSSVRAIVMHAGKSQDIRESNLEGFKSGRFGVMIATDVVGRGIDIKGVKHVINYEMPEEMEKYTHRIGRTGRAGEKGTAWSLTTPNDSDIFPALRKLLQQAGADIPREIDRYDGVPTGPSRGVAPNYGKPIID